MSFHYSPKPIIDNSLVLYFDAANSKSLLSGATLFNDISRTGNNTTSSFQPTYDSLDGGSLFFNGTTNRLQTIRNPQLTNQITIEFWYKTLNVSGSQPPPGFGVGFIGGRETQYRMLVTNINVQWVCATVNNSWYSTGTVTPSIPIPNITNVWTQVVGVYDGVRNSIYLNGGRSSASSPNTISGNILNLGFGNFGIGYPIDASPGVNTVNAFNGNIAIVKVYNRALSPSEILQNFNAIKSRFNIN